MRRLAALLLAGSLAAGLAACENGPKMADLAPKIPKLNPEVPETTHPELVNGEYPNINEAPDRPSVMHSEEKLKEIEKSLEQDGERHVKEAVGTITGKPPAEADQEDSAGGEEPAAGDAGQDAGETDVPLRPGSPPDEPS